MTVASPSWAELREPADAAARAGSLLDVLRAELPPDRPVTVWNARCGDGALSRWLAPRLHGPQHWIMHDSDPALAARAVEGITRAASDGTPVTAPVTAEVRVAALAELRAADVVGTSVLAACDVLHRLTAAEVDAFAATACRPALLTLTPIGRVRLDPADPLDVEFAAAADAHRRRDGRLGVDAAFTAADAFTRRGATVHTRPSPWRLGPARSALMAQWLRGWVAAAVEHRPALAADAPAYLRRRLADCANGDLTVEVRHLDLLAVPAR
ncbi:SAM-dependent methyltransferase [Actinomadura sp. WMMB 499]|uniref:SAM-dependent methyltransferase n=1 Tax=Actinomadura sp. WMMB 499 TaxID=1219491 RepID=UPI001244AB7C|nr:SAM-dependent methyltransferase [Actinomadura sp. WMMB 499]QFG20803.1 SAM-dependent methyltransferase [Actinomadura sp. WMMB 499]